MLLILLLFVLLCDCLRSLVLLVAIAFGPLLDFWGLQYLLLLVDDFFIRQSSSTRTSLCITVQSNRSFSKRSTDSETIP
jgi:hypothetical protein